MKKILFIIPCIPYPLTSGGNQAFFHMVDYLRHKMSVSILLYPKGKEKKDVEKLKEIWECDRIVSFGDAVNDIPMFEMSDECYAVENAVAELKAVATGIIGRNDQDGVARWLLEHCGEMTEP